MPDTLWIHYALARTAWYELDDSRRGALEETWKRIRTQSLDGGAQTEGVFSVRGQSDFSTVEVWRFPDVEAAYTYWERLTEAGYSQWFESANNLGMRTS
jgi:hypothetical protein